MRARTLDKFNKLCSCTLEMRISTNGYNCKGVARGGSWGARDPPPLCKPFLSKQPTVFRGENAMTIMFDKV